MAAHSKNRINYFIKMKKKFSIKWKGSTQKRKQRKYRFNAPLHIRKKFVSANLSKDLRKKYGRRSFPLRKGDTIKVMNGEFKKKTGKVLEVDLIRSKIIIENTQRAKKDGTKVNVSFHPSNLQITELNLEDKRRIKSLGKDNSNNLKINKEIPEKTK